MADTELFPQKAAQYADIQSARAFAHYNAHYDNELYSAAVRGKSTRYANNLIDNALAICGDPYHKITWRDWPNDALKFLSKFS